MNIPTLTLDTSCVISLLRLPGDSTTEDELHALEQIKELGMNSQIELFVSEKSRTEAKINLDKSKNLDPGNWARAEKWIETLKILGDFKSLKGRWILGMSHLGVDTVLGSDVEAVAHKEMAQLFFGKFPNELSEGNAFDLAILFEHFTQGNYLFVTRDTRNKMLQKRAEIKKRWNIVVCTPIEALGILNAALSNSSDAG